MFPKRSTPLLCVVLSAACASKPSEDSGWIGDTANDFGKVESVVPEFGTNAGGTFVTIEGGPFPEDPTVTFGGVEATILQATPDQIQVEAPPSEKLDWVQLKIVGADGGEVKENKAYQYWQDGLGQTGMWGEIYRLDYVGGYWSPQGGGGTFPYTPPPIGSARYQFLQPADFEYEDLFAPGLDLCEVGYNPGLNATSIFTGLDEARITGTDGGVIDLTLGGDNYMQNLDIDVAQLDSGAVYSLESGKSTREWPAFGLEDLTTFPSRPTIMTPDLGSNSITTNGPTINLQWNSEDAGDYIIAILRRSPDGGATIEDSVTCLLRDDGAHSVSATYWTAWTPGVDFVLIQLGRVIVSNRTLPHNRAMIQVPGIYWTFGAIIAE